MTSIILVRPQLAENIGMVARAMLNFDFDQLRLVHPRDGWPNPQATAAAAGADRVLQHAQVFQSVEEAVSDLSYVYATTARTRDIEKPVQDLSEISANQSIQTGVLFGAEASGLTNQELALADALLTIQTNPEFSSLNLAQSVVLVCHQLNQVSKQAPKKIEAAPKQELHFLLKQLENRLEQKNFFKPIGKKPLMVQNLSAIFTRAGLTSQEIQTLHGVLKTLSK